MGWTSVFWGGKQKPMGQHCARNGMCRSASLFMQILQWQNLTILVGLCFCCVKHLAFTALLLLWRNYCLHAFACCFSLLRLYVGVQTACFGNPPIDQNI